MLRVKAMFAAIWILDLLVCCSPSWIWFLGIVVLRWARGQVCVALHPSKIWEYGGSGATVWPGLPHRWKKSYGAAQNSGPHGSVRPGWRVCVFRAGEHEGSGRRLRPPWSKQQRRMFEAYRCRVKRRRTFILSTIFNNVCVIITDAIVAVLRMKLLWKYSGMGLFWGSTLSTVFKYRYLPEMGRSDTL